MQTIIKKIDAINPNNNIADISEAASILRNGGLVAFPTETVYGLGANALDPSAIKKIYEAKGRPSDNPLIIHISSMSELLKVACEVLPMAYKLAEAFWPGPLTMILPKTHTVPCQTTGGLSSVAVRMPANLIAALLIKEAGVPIAAPSANSSGKPSTTDASHVEFDLNGKVDMILDGGSASLGIESTVIDLTVCPPCILRPGSVTIEMIQKVCPEAIANTHLSLKENEQPKSPGMKYTHYSPRAQVIVISGIMEDTVAKINLLTSGYLQKRKKVGIMACDETVGFYNASGAHIISVGNRERIETVAENLFKVLRDFDFYGVDVILAEGLSKEGLGTSIMDRLVKASGNTVIYV